VSSTRRRPPPKPTPMEAFDLNMSDAIWMIELAEALDNQRPKGVYSNTRESLGTALRMTKSERDGFEVTESADFFVIIKPGSAMSRDSLQDRTALLRHAIVAACAATETFFADLIVDLVRPQLHAHRTRHTTLPRKLRDVTLTVGDAVDLDHRYKSRRGLTEQVVGPYIRDKASVHPDSLGPLLQLAGHSDALKRIDRELQHEKGWSYQRMSEIAQRRNRIAHTGDRQGRGRKHLSAEEARSITDDLTAIVRAAEALLVPQRSTSTRVDHRPQLYDALVRQSEPVDAPFLAELTGIPKLTVSRFLNQWSKDDHDDSTYPGVIRVSRGRYLYVPP
jgi:hypothetical protein